MGLELTTHVHLYLVVYSESNDLCEEGASESGGDQQTVALGTLVETLAHHMTGKLVVTECDVGWVFVVGVHLGRGGGRGERRERGEEREGGEEG